ncbi:MAG: hypothetical protein K2I18_10670 [Paramuribaculum sp.]|nr:hypothetical protein [Paramuribaculum sp.]
MKKRIIIASALLIIVFGAAYASLTMLTSQKSMKPDHSGGLIGIMPLRNDLLEVEVVPGLRFKLDTGSDMSTITCEDLHLLDSLGFTATKSFYPVIGRDGNGDLHLETDRYTVALPMMNYKFTTDTAGVKTAYCSRNDVNILHNVDFTLSRTGQSVLGIDFLEKFQVEYQHLNRAIALHDKQPDNYQKCSDITYSRSIAHGLWLGKRYYMTLDVNVNGVVDNFFLDTGLRTGNLKLPKKMASNTPGKLRTDTVYSARGIYPALSADNVLVGIGDRIGRATVIYYNNDEEDKAFNPIRMINQDFLLDFAEGVLYLHPIYDIPDKAPDTVGRIVVTD